MLPPKLHFRTILTHIVHFWVIKWSYSKETKSDKTMSFFPVGIEIYQALQIYLNHCIQAICLTERNCSVFVCMNQIHNCILSKFDFQLPQCSVGEAVRRALEYISSGKPKIMFFGPGCSKATIPVAEAIHYWNIVQVRLRVLPPMLSHKG